MVVAYKALPVLAEFPASVNSIDSIISSDELSMPYIFWSPSYHVTVLTETGTRYCTLAHASPACVCLVHFKNQEF